jgi:hypothetical protein
VSAAKTKDIDLEVRIALLGQRQDQLEASIEVLDKRLGRMEESLNALRSDVPRWGGALAVVAGGSPFLSVFLSG